MDRCERENWLERFEDSYSDSYLMKQAMMYVPQAGQVRFP